MPPDPHHASLTPRPLQAGRPATGGRAGLRISEPHLDLDAIRDLVRARLEPPDSGALQRIAEALYDASGGWEPLVRLALDEGPAPWEQPEDLTDRLTAAGGPVSRWVRGELLPTLERDAADLAVLVAGLAPVPRRLVEELAPGGVTAYDALVAARLIRPDEDGVPQVVPLVSAALRHEQARDRDGWRLLASSWFDRAGEPGPALRAARLAGDHAACARLVERYGDAIAASGWSREVLAAIPAPPTTGSTRLLVHWGHNARVAGRPLVALRALQAALATTSGSGQAPPPDLAWRLAQVHYGRGDFAAAERLCREAESWPAPEGAADRARRLACRSAALRALGDQESAREAAEAAVAVVESAAGGAGESAHALALLTRALVLTGARRHNDLAEALTHAEQAEDVLLTQRILVNLSDAHLVAAEFEPALARARRALALGRRTGPIGCFTVALHNQGEALLWLGELAAARTSFLRSLDLARQHGLARTPAALGGLAEADYQAGLLADAAAAYRETIELADDVDDLETLAPALARLATIEVTLAEREAEPDRVAAHAHAVALADRAVATAEPDHLPAALVARGWVAVAAGAPDAPALAEAALAAARRAPVRRALGEALELCAAAAGHQRDSLRALEQAVEVYDRSGAGARADRVRVTIGRLPVAGRAHRAAARAAARRLRRAEGLAVDPGAGPSRGHHPGGAVAGGHAVVRVLGSLQVHVDGTPVPGTAWRSRQARTLLKLLLARHGRPVSREELCESLWPDDDPARTGHRLSVLLSSLRLALDPGRRWPTDQFLVADAQGLRVATAHVTLDLDDFLADAEEATLLVESGEEHAARRLLADLLQEHHGEAFEDDPFEAWAAQARDHVRAVRVQCLRTAARLAGRAGDVDQAITLLVRLLAIDPYDEPAHRLLVAALARAGRHGEARRAFDRWTRANRELGVPAPEPAVRYPPVAS